MLWCPICVIFIKACEHYTSVPKHAASWNKYFFCTYTCSSIVSLLQFKKTTALTWKKENRKHILCLIVITFTYEYITSSFAQPLKNTAHYYLRKKEKEECSNRKSEAHYNILPWTLLNYKFGWHFLQQFVCLPCYLFTSRVG